MSEIGYYRYKTTVASTSKNIQFFKNGILAGTKTLEPMEFCTGTRVLKYLDTKGKYRFFAFSKFYRVSDNPKQIGTTNNFITNLLTDQTNSQSVGSKNARSLDLTAQVSESRLELLQSIYASPRVHLYIGANNSDTAADWVEVEITGGDSIVKRRRASTGSISLTVKLPEHFSIRMV